jgi:hypothetical protein
MDDDQKYRSANWLKAWKAHGDENKLQLSSAKSSVSRVLSEIACSRQLRVAAPHFRRPTMAQWSPQVFQIPFVSDNRCESVVPIPGDSAKQTKSTRLPSGSGLETRRMDFSLTNCFVSTTAPSPQLLWMGYRL